MRRKSTILTQQELEIMKVVWEHDTVTVREVYETLLKRRKVAYTTVMTMMKILEQKKYLKKNQTDHHPCVPPGSAARQSHQGHGAGLREPRIQRFGRAAAGLEDLVEEHDLSREDLEEIARRRVDKS